MIKATITVSVTGSIGTDEEAAGSGRDVEVEVEEERRLLHVVGELHAGDADSAGIFVFCRHCCGTTIAREGAIHILLGASRKVTRQCTR